MNYLHINPAKLGDNRETEIKNLTKIIKGIQSREEYREDVILVDYIYELEYYIYESEDPIPDERIKEIKDRISLLKVIIELKTESSDTLSEGTTSSESSVTLSEGIQNPKYCLSEESNDGYPIPKGKDREMLISYLEYAYKYNNEIETYIPIGLVSLYYSNEIKIKDSDVEYTLPFFEDDPDKDKPLAEIRKIVEIEENERLLGLEENELLTKIKEIVVELEKSDGSSVLNDNELFTKIKEIEGIDENELLTKMKRIVGPSGVNENELFEKIKKIEGIEKKPRWLGIYTLRNNILEKYHKEVISALGNQLTDIKGSETEETKKNILLLKFLSHNLNKYDSRIDLYKKAIEKNNTRALQIMLSSYRYDDNAKFIKELLKHAFENNNKNPEIILQLLNRLGPSEELTFNGENISEEFTVNGKAMTVANYVLCNNIHEYQKMYQIKEEDITLDQIKHIITNNQNYMLEKIATKIDPNLKDEDDNNIFHLAAKSNNPDILDTYLTNGNYGGILSFLGINDKNKDGKTPLMLTIEKDPNYEMARHHITYKDCDLKQYFVKSDGSLIGDIPAGYDENKFKEYLTDCQKITLNKMLFIKSDLSKTDNKNNNAFHIAAEKNNLHALTLLIKYNLFYSDNKNYLSNKNEDGKTPLMIAIEKGNLDAVKLLAPKSDLTISDNYGNNPIHLAMLNGDNHVLWELITPFSGKGVKERTDKLKKIDSAINTKNKHGKTPLMIAIEKGNLDAVKALAPKSDLTISDKYGNNPIHLAAMAKATTMADGTSKGAAAGGGAAPKPANKTDILNELLKANTKGWMDKNTGGLLSSVSISPKDKRNKYGKTPYHLAVESGNIETVEALERAQVDVTKTTSDKFGALHLLVKAGTSNHSLIQHLTNKKELIKVQDGENRTPLFYAQSTDVIQTLIEGGIDPNHNDKYGFNALNHILKFEGKRNAEVVTALLGAGSNIDQISKAWGSNIDLIGQKKEDIKLDEFSKAIKQENVRTRIERKIDNTDNIREFNRKYGTNLNGNEIYLKSDLLDEHSKFMKKFKDTYGKNIDTNKMYNIADIEKLRLSDVEKGQLMPLASENYMQAIETITYDESEFEIREKAQLKREEAHNLNKENPEEIQYLLQQAKNLLLLADNIKEAKQIIYEAYRTEDDKVRDLIEKNKSYQMPRVQLELERLYRSKKLIEHERTKFAKTGRIYTALKELANYKKDDKHAPKNITKENFSLYLGKIHTNPPAYQNPNLIIKHTDGVIKIYTDDFKIKITNQDKCEIKRYGGSYKTLEDANNYLSHIIGTESHPHPNSPAYIDKQESFPDHDRILFHDSYGNFKLESGKTNDIDVYIARKYPEIDFSGFSKQQKLEIVYKHQQDMFHKYDNGNIDKIEKDSISNDFPEKNSEILDVKAWDSLSQIAYEHNYHLNVDRLDKIKASYDPENPNPLNAFLTSNPSYINARKILKEIHEESVNRAKNVMKMHPQGVITLADFLNERTSKNEKPIWMSDDVTTLNDNGTVTLDYAKYKLSKSEKEQLKEYPDDMRLLGKKNRYEALKALNGKNITKDKHKLAVTRYLGSYTSAAYNSKAIKDLDKMMPVESSEHSYLAPVKESDKNFLKNIANEDKFNIMASLGINDAEYKEMTSTVGCEVKSGMLYEYSFDYSSQKVKAALELIADSKVKKEATKELDKKINDINAKTLTEADKIQELKKYLEGKKGPNNTDPINIRYKAALDALNSHKAVKIANKSDWFSLKIPAAHLANCIVRCTGDIRDRGEPEWLPDEWKNKIDMSNSTYNPSTHKINLLLKDGVEHEIDIFDSKSISAVFGPKLIYGTPEENGIKHKIQDRLGIDENEYAQLTNTMGFEVKKGGMIRTTTSISSTYYSFNDSAEKVKAALELIADSDKKNIVITNLDRKITEINDTTNDNGGKLTEAEKIQELKKYLEGKKGTNKTHPINISYQAALDALNSHKTVKIANESDWFSLNVPAAHLASCIVRRTLEPEWLPHEWKGRIDILNSTYDPSTHELKLHLKDAPKHPITIDITHSKSISDVFGENMVYRVANKTSREYNNSDYAKCSLEETPDIIFIRDHEGKMKDLREINFDLYTGNPNHLKNASFSFDSFFAARTDLLPIDRVISFQKYLQAAARSATPRVNIYDISFDQLARQVESILDKVITDPDKDRKIAYVRHRINEIKESSNTDKISEFLYTIDMRVLSIDEIQKCIPEISATKRLEIAKAINNTALIKECNLMAKDCQKGQNISDKTWEIIGLDRNNIKGMTRIEEFESSPLDTILEKGYMLNHAVDEMLLISRLIQEGMASYNIDNRIIDDNKINRNKALDPSNDKNSNQFLRASHAKVDAEKFRSYRKLFDYLSEAEQGMDNYFITKFKNEHKEFPPSYAYLDKLLKDYIEETNRGNYTKASEIMEHIETFGQVLGSDEIIKLKESNLSVPAAEELLRLMKINDLSRFKEYCSDTTNTSHQNFLEEAKQYISQETTETDFGFLLNFFYTKVTLTPEDNRCIKKEEFTRINEVLNKLHAHDRILDVEITLDGKKQSLGTFLTERIESFTEADQKLAEAAIIETYTQSTKDEIKGMFNGRELDEAGLKTVKEKINKFEQESGNTEKLSAIKERIDLLSDTKQKITNLQLKDLDITGEDFDETLEEKIKQQFKKTGEENRFEYIDYVREKLPYSFPTRLDQLYTEIKGKDYANKFPETEKAIIEGKDGINAIFKAESYSNIATCLQEDPYNGIEEAINIANIQIQQLGIYKDEKLLDLLVTLRSKMNMERDNGTDPNLKSFSEARNYLAARLINPNLDQLELKKVIAKTEEIITATEEKIKMAPLLGKINQLQKSVNTLNKNAHLLQQSVANLIGNTMYNNATLMGLHASVTALYQDAEVNNTELGKLQQSVNTLNQKTQVNNTKLGKLQHSVNTLNQKTQVNNTKLVKLQQSVDHENYKIGGIATSVSSMEANVEILNQQLKTLVSDTNRRLIKHSSTMSNMDHSLRRINNSLLGLDQTQQQISYQQQQQIAGQEEFLAIAENFQVRIVALEGMQQQGNQIDERIAALSDIIAGRVIDIMREANPNQDDELTSLKEQVENLKNYLEKNLSSPERIAELERFEMFTKGIKITPPEGKPIQDFLIEAVIEAVKDTTVTDKENLENITIAEGQDHRETFISLCKSVINTKYEDKDKINIINNVYKKITGKQTDLISEIDDLKKFHNSDLDRAILNVNQERKDKIEVKKLNKAYSMYYLNIAGAKKYIHGTSQNILGITTSYQKSFDALSNKIAEMNNNILNMQSLPCEDVTNYLYEGTGKEKISKIITDNGCKSMQDLLETMNPLNKKTTSLSGDEYEAMANAVISNISAVISNISAVMEIRSSVERTCHLIGSHDSNNKFFKESFIKATKEKAYNNIFNESYPSADPGLSAAIFTKIEVLSTDDPNTNEIDLYSRADIETKVALFEIELNNQNTGSHYYCLTHDQQIYSEIYREILNLPIDEKEKETFRAGIIEDNKLHTRQYGFHRERGEIEIDVLKTTIVSELESKFKIKLEQLEIEEIPNKFNELDAIDTTTKTETNLIDIKNQILVTLRQGRNILYLLDKTYPDKNIPNLTEKIKKIDPKTNYINRTDPENLLKELGINDPDMSSLSRPSSSR